MPGVSHTYRIHSKILPFVLYSAATAPAPVSRSTSMTSDCEKEVVARRFLLIGLDNSRIISDGATLYLDSDWDVKTHLWRRVALTVTFHMCEGVEQFEEIDSFVWDIYCNSKRRLSTPFESFFEENYPNLLRVILHSLNGHAIAQPIALLLLGF